jgi:hypothetical protein
MSRRTILAGLAATVAATAIAAPAQAQQQPTPDTTIRFGHCLVARSSHGYTYARCAVFADNLMYGKSASISYTSNLKPFKPRTNVEWSGKTDTFTLTNDGSLPGTAPGFSNTVDGVIRLAFKDKSVEQVKKELIVAATGTNGATDIQPIAAPAQG